MEQLQAPPGSNLGQEPAKGWFAPGAGRAPAAEPVPGASPRSAGRSGTEAGAEVSTAEQNRSKGRRKTGPLSVMRYAVLRVVPLVHRRAPRCFA